jgi:hypothetical protein
VYDVENENSGERNRGKMEDGRCMEERLIKKDAWKKVKKNKNCPDRLILC